MLAAGVVAVVTLPALEPRVAPTACVSGQYPPSAEAADFSSPPETCESPRSSENIQSTAAAKVEQEDKPGTDSGLAKQLASARREAPADPAKFAEGMPSAASVKGSSSELATENHAEAKDDPGITQTATVQAKAADAKDPSAEKDEAGSPDNLSRGIGAAKHHADMQKAADMQQYSGSKEQQLPGNSVPSAALATAQGLDNHSNASVTDAVGPALLAASGMPALSRAETSATEAVVTAPPVGASRSLERTHDLVSLHALRLRDSSEDSLRVMIRPGPGMQLSLDLQMRDGGVEVHALLNRGDYEFLNSHWAELQHQLEPRGVRLSALSHSESSASGQSFEHPRRRQEQGEPQEVLSPLPFVEAAAASKAELPVRPTTRGWNYWA